MDKICLKCGNPHDGNYGSGKYCNVKCANSRIRTDEIKKKISDGVKKSKSWERIDRENFDKEKQIKSLKETWRKKRPNWDDVHISTKKRWLKEDTDECQMCGLKEWLNEKIKLEVDHIDGNKHNNKRENLRLLCPNCHSTTPTWRKPNKNLVN